MGGFLIAFPFHELYITSQVKRNIRGGFNDYDGGMQENFALHNFDLKVEIIVSEFMDYE